MTFGLLFPASTPKTQHTHACPRAESRGGVRRHRPPQALRLLESRCQEPPTPLPAAGPSRCRANNHLRVRVNSARALEATGRSCVPALASDRALPNPFSPPLMTGTDRVRGHSLADNSSRGGICAFGGGRCFLALSPWAARPRRGLLMPPTACKQERGFASQMRLKASWQGAAWACDTHDQRISAGHSTYCCTVACRAFSSAAAGVAAAEDNAADPTHVVTLCCAGNRRPNCRTSGWGRLHRSQGGTTVGTTVLCAAVLFAQQHTNSPSGNPAASLLCGRRRDVTVLTSSTRTTRTCTAPVLSR